MRQWSDLQHLESRTIGFVPTMGALHDGHLHLLKTSKNANDLTVLSIFVNPTQFNSPVDFDKYPRTIDEDLALAESVGVDAVFAPSATEMYPQGFDTTIDPGSIAVGMEGEFRPGHFQGVATVVVKLLNATFPTRLYLGQKDYQQLAVLRQVVTDLDIPVDVVPVETIRHSDGLAMSSRNTRLTAQHRKDATIIHSALSRAVEIAREGEKSAENIRQVVHATLAQASSCRVEYVSIVDARDLTPVSEIRKPVVVCVAAHFGEVRLIDNMVIEV